MYGVWLLGWWYNIEDPAITLKRYYDTYETKIQKQGYDPMYGVWLAGWWYNIEDPAITQLSPR